MAGSKSPSGRIIKATLFSQNLQFFSFFIPHLRKRLGEDVFQRLAEENKADTELYEYADTLLTERIGRTRFFGLKLLCFKLRKRQLKLKSQLSGWKNKIRSLTGQSAV